MKRHVLDPAQTIGPAGPPIDPEWLAAAAALPSSTLHEAGAKIGALPAAIKPVTLGMRLCGRALTVTSPPGDNLWLHRAIYVAQPGDVLVVDVGSAYEHGYWGEIMSTAARHRGIAGFLINGCVRDGGLLAGIGLPVFARGLAIRGTGKDFAARGWINAPVLMGNIVIQPGDLIVGDDDGVVAVPHARIAEVVGAGREREIAEVDIVRKLHAGETTLDIYDLALPR